MTYADFLASKGQSDTQNGFAPTWAPDFLFPFQASLTEWATRQGRAAIFADCGLGKTPMALTWAHNVYLYTGKPVLIVTPLAVTFQFETEARKFGLDAAISRTGQIPSPITVTNYDRLHLFDTAEFGGVVADESSAIKSFDGARRALVTEFLRTQTYRLLSTATAAPNDYVELGTSSEALGYLGRMDGLQEERAESRRTVAERCERAADLLVDADRAVAWCQLNDEGDLLTRLIDGAVQVSGSDSTDAKEERLAAFTRGEIRVLVIKPVIGAWGLNWQHCHRMTYFPSHSYEQMYQAVRRSWRFGQTSPVEVDVITTEGGRRALANLQRKAEQADRMFTALVAHMRDAAGVRRSDPFDIDVEVPSWAKS